MQHFIYHLSPRGTAGFVLANGSLTSKTGGEGDIRKKLVQADLVDCIVALPEKLFLNTGISVSLWFVSKDRHGQGTRKREGEILFIDARSLGTMVSRKLRELTDGDIAQISGAYHAWRNSDGKHQDVTGFSKVASIEEIANHDFVLTPSRYVGTLDTDVDDEPVSDKIERLTRDLLAEFDRGREIEAEIRAAVRRLS